MPPVPLLSIVLATYCRLEHLRRCLESIQLHVRTPHETIVVAADGGDGTLAWLAGRQELRVIPEAQREGATRAYNKGFRAARGEYVMWLNDDARVLPGAVEAALELIRRPESSDVGMVAFYHTLDQPQNRLDQVEHGGKSFGLYNVRGWVYANFGLLRRALLHELDYLDERYYFCAWDPDLSLKVQKLAGLRVLGCRAALIDHEEWIDQRKTDDLAVARRDNERLFAKWGLPEKETYADPAPAYRALLSARGLA